MIYFLNLSTTAGFNTEIQKIQVPLESAQFTIIVLNPFTRSDLLKIRRQVVSWAPGCPLLQGIEGLIYDACACMLINTALAWL